MKDPNDLKSFDGSVNPSDFNLAADFIYIEKEWGSLFYKHFGKNTRIKAKELCAQEGNEVHLPIPRSNEENEFYRVYFGEKNVWLGIIDDSNGIATDGFEWGSRIPNEKKSIYVSRRNQENKSKILYDWLKFKGSIENNESYIKGLQLTKSGQWESIKETDEVNTVCVYNIIPNECSKCSDKYFCQYFDEKQQAKCICKFDVEDATVISNIIQESEKLQDQYMDMPSLPPHQIFYYSKDYFYNANIPELDLSRFRGYRSFNC